MPRFCVLIIVLMESLENIFIFALTVILYIKTPVAELREENPETPTEANKVLLDFDGRGIIHPNMTLHIFRVRIYDKMWSNYVHAKTLFQLIRKYFLLW